MLSILLNVQMRVNSQDFERFLSAAKVSSTSLPWDINEMCYGGSVEKVGVTRRSGTGRHRTTGYTNFSDTTHRRIMEACLSCRRKGQTSIANKSFANLLLMPHAPPASQAPTFGTAIADLKSHRQNRAQAHMKHLSANIRNTKSTARHTSGWL